MRFSTSSHAPAGILSRSRDIISLPVMLDARRRLPVREPAIKPPTSLRLSFSAFESLGGRRKHEEECFRLPFQEHPGAGSVVSHSLQPYGLQPARLLCPWDFPGETTGIVYHFLLQGMFPTQGLNPSLLHLLHYWKILYC